VQSYCIKHYGLLWGVIGFEVLTKSGLCCLVSEESLYRMDIKLHFNSLVQDMSALVELNHQIQECFKCSKLIVSYIISTRHLLLKGNQVGMPK
jgi:hypothetical protein